jgi:hypothetical protein
MKRRNPRNRNVRSNPSRRNLDQMVSKGITATEEVVAGSEYDTPEQRNTD